MDPEFGDDLIHGFSDEEIIYGEGEEPEEEESGLDLLTAMLESSSTKKREKAKAVGRKRSSCNEEESCSNGSVKRRKVAKENEENTSTKSAESSKEEDVSEMKARLQEMEKEMMRLREEVRKSSEVKKGERPKPKAPPISPPTLRTEATRLPKSGKKKRVAHETMATKKKVSSQKSSATPGGGRAVDRGVANDIIKQRQEDEETNVITEKYSKLRIKNPLISSDVMRQRMSGRKMISIPKLHSKMKDGDIEGDWVTIGVLVDKLPPRDSVKGNKYTIWKLSDLSSQTAVISLFLFGKSYQEHWKTSVGMVLALLNPNIMPAKEGGDGGSGFHYSSVALSLDNPLKLMLMGVSRDFTVCKAVTKSGKKCTNFASLAHGGHCDYHVQAAYSKMRSQRMEFQTGYGPNSNKGKLKERLFRDSKTDVYYYGGKTFTEPGKSSRTSNERGAPLERMFVPGAHSAASRAMEELRERREAAGLGGVSSRGGVTTHEGSEVFKQMLQTQTIGARMMTKHFHKEDMNRKKEEKKLTPEKSASELLKEHKKAVNSPTLRRQPQLGRGLMGGGVVDLSGCRGASVKPATKASLAKLRALEFVHKNGPLEVKDSLTNKKSSAITQRVKENRRQEDDGDDNTDEAKRETLDTVKLERILKAKSSHDWVVKEEEREKEEEYFERLEKKENIEEKMATVKEIRVNVVQCKLCKYTAEGQSELCKKENHRICRFKALKRCFQCRQCHTRSFTYNTPLPVHTCSKCGGQSHEATSFYRERKGPRLANENLLVRGEEEKFLNSLR